MMTFSADILGAPAADWRQVSCHIDRCRSLPLPYS
jgi:hypothetical protein